MDKEETILKLTENEEASREELVINSDAANPLSLYDMLTSFEKNKEKFFINEKQDILYKNNDAILSIDKKGSTRPFVIHKDILSDRYYEILSITEVKLASECYCGECTDKNVEVVPILNEDIIKELNKGHKLLFFIEEFEGEVVLCKGGMSVITNTNEDDIKKGFLPVLILSAMLEGNWEKVISEGEVK